jgi:predicted O-methyltransferase YrrM
VGGPSLILFPEKTDDGSYRPSFQVPGDDLGERHLGAEARVAAVPGWLRPEDALKLYELAFLTTGPILEIGTFQGKSAILMAGALQDAGSDATLYSLDVDQTCLQAARAYAVVHGVADRIVFVRGTARAFVRAYPQLRPSLTFIDGDHSYAGVRRDLAVLEDVVPDDGLLLFHDFHDPRNDDPADAEVKVTAAVADSWVARDCDFGGVFGCCGLFARRHRGARAPDAPVSDLLALDSIRDQWVQRVRRPLGRAWRRRSA